MQETFTVHDPKRQRQDALQRIESLENDLEAEKAKVSRIDLVLDGLQAIYGEKKIFPPKSMRFNGDKVRSTEMVATLVSEAPGGLTHEEIHAKFYTRWGEQKWRDPRNALTTAISRAVERGLITKGPDGKFRHV